MEHTANYALHLGTTISLHVLQTIKVGEASRQGLDFGILSHLDHQHTITSSQCRNGPWPATAPWQPEIAGLVLTVSEKTGFCQKQASVLILSLPYRKTPCVLQILSLCMKMHSAADSCLTQRMTFWIPTSAVKICCTAVEHLHRLLLGCMVVHLEFTKKIA